MRPPLRNGRRRAVTVLTSKALWCCYPNDVPILDSYAEQALWVICRLSGKEPARNQSRRARFVDGWFQVYGDVRLAIEQADLNGYPYRVRVLDKLLWYLGQP